jgi:uncharacterized protein (DUF2141 family)
MHSLSILFILIIVNCKLYAQNFQLKVVIKNLDVKAGGKLFVALYDQSTFPIDGKQLKGIIIPVDESNVSALFTKISAGKYAIAVYQDVNGNNKLDKNFVGYPTEPFAFSRNYKVKFSAPKFKDVAIEVNKDGVTEIILP